MGAQPVGTQEKAKSTDGVKRLNLNLSEEIFNELSRLAKDRRSSMTEIIRLAIALVRVALHEAKLGNKLVVTTADGQAIKELVVAP
jgi:hypothetical protein